MTIDDDMLKILQDMCGMGLGWVLEWKWEHIYFS